jgi:hypothetical protein
LYITDAVGGGLYITDGGLLIGVGGTVVLSASAVDGNTARAEGSGIAFGGGVAAGSGTLTAGGATYALRPFDKIFVPAALGPWQLNPSPTLDLLECLPPSA